MVGEMVGQRLLSSTTEQGWCDSMARYGSAEVQRLWLEKWSPSDCCPELQSKDGWTVAVILACNGSAEVQRLWLEKWSAISVQSYKASAERQ